MFEQNKNFEVNSSSAHLLKLGGAVLAGALLATDFAKGYYEASQRRTNTELCANNLMNADRTLLWEVGCAQEGKEAYSQLVQRTSGVNIIATRLPEKSPSGTIDEDEASMVTLEKLLETGAWHPDIVAESRAALNVVRLLQVAHRTGIAEQLGGFGTVVFNASPHDGNDITPSRSRWLNGAIGLQYSATAERLKQRVLQGTTHSSLGRTPLTKTAAEGRSIRRAPAVNPIPPIIDKLIYVRGQYHDPTVYAAQAAEKWRADAPAGTFEEYIDLSRTVGTHIGNGERFDLLLELVGVVPNTATEEPLAEEVTIHFNHQAQAA